MKQVRKIKLNIGTILLFGTIFLILFLAMIFIINKSLFRYKIFFNYDKSNIIIAKIIEPSNLKQNDIIIYKTDNRILQNEIIKINIKDNSYYFIVNNYDNTQEIVLNQNQIYSKYLYEIKGLGKIVKKVPMYCIIIGIITTLGVVVYIVKRKNKLI